MKNWLRVTICVALVVSILAMSLSVFATDPEPTPTVPPLDTDNRVVVSVEMASLYVWKILDAWGIKVAPSSWAVTTEELIAWVKQMLLDYAIDTGVTIAQLIAPWLFQFDIWGNLMANDRATRDIENFANWLINKIGLSDNEEVIVDPLYVVSGGTLFRFDTWYNAVSISSDPYYNVFINVQADIENTNSTLGYCIVRLENSGSPEYYMVCVSDTGGRAVYSMRGIKMDDTVFTLTATAVNHYQMSTNSIYYGYVGVNWGLLPEGTWITVADFNEFYNFLLGLDIELSGDIKVITSHIELPSQNTDYVDGDSMTVIDGIPDYSLVEWPESISVDNLPAVVSTDKIDNPHLEEAYRPIQGLITYAKDGVAVCTALLYELPDELVYLWYGLIASIIIWGMIKLMREH